MEDAALHALQPAASSLDLVLNDVARERDAQDEQWGQQDHDGTIWATILGEEYGEACKAVLYNKYTPYATTEHDALGRAYEARVALLRKELIQVAAVAVAWVEALDREVS